MDDTITVYGTGRRRVAPDIGTWQAIVEARGASERAAYGECAAAMARVIQAVTAAAAAGVEVSAGAISVGQEWDDTGRRRVGAVASGAVSVRGPLTQLAAAGQVALDGGAVRLDGPLYEVSTAGQVLDELAAEAVTHAMARAALIAQAAGRALGAVVRIVDGIAAPPSPDFGLAGDRRELAQMKAVGPGPVSPSEHELQADVTVTLRLV